jgi:PBP1b-binding outer membrane lipoprotein LpoB
MRFVISLLLGCLLLTACSKKEGYRYLGDTEPNQQTVPQNEPDEQE